MAIPLDNLQIETVPGGPKYGAIEFSCMADSETPIVSLCASRKRHAKSRRHPQITAIQSLRCQFTEEIPCGMGDSHPVGEESQPPSTCVVAAADKLEVIPKSHFKNPAPKLLVRDAVNPGAAIRAALCGKVTRSVIQVEVL